MTKVIDVYWCADGVYRVFETPVSGGYHEELLKWYQKELNIAISEYDIHRIWELRSEYEKERNSSTGA